MNAAEFKEKIIPLSGKLFHFARLLLKDHAEAEDSVQEIFLKLWKLRDDLKKYDNIEAFAMRVTRNWCLDRIKAKKPLYIDNYTSGFDQYSDTDSPLGLLEKADQMSTVSRIIQTLPEQQKTIIQLRDIEGYEYEEIANIMNMNINAVRVSLSRARNTIREQLINFVDYGYSKNKNTAR
ncbi:MAG: RNA polymerase sigma factor [Bacteroidales bacterium]|nr:RNA polymerase sigma factor [Bacteroidales bacterium]